MISFLALLAALLFWENQILCSLLLIILAGVKHKFSPIKRELVLFVLSGMIGSLMESAMIANGVWFYTQPFFFNLPLWLPFLWGLTGITGITFYKGLQKKVNQ